ncbi:MAG: hypothetical protein IPM36_03520 [Lewinellaceae bacterium]|nr:hypothetical protein [Lewinellaceae bacterium]
MITTEKVCKLIATLDANEKRYFRALIGRQEKSKPQYLLLFDLIAENIGIDENGEACCMLDEAGLIVRLRRRKVPENQFHVVRYNLTHALLKALRLKQEELSSESLIKNQLVNAKVLEHRGLSDWASEMAEEALHTARKFEYHGLAIEALQTLVYFRSQQNARGYAEQTRAYLDDLQQVIRQFEAEVLLFSLWHQAFILYRTGIGSMSVDLKKDVEQLLQHPALVEAAVPDSFLGKIYSCRRGPYWPICREGSRLPSPGLPGSWNFGRRRNTGTISRSARECSVFTWQTTLFFALQSKTLPATSATSGHLKT